MEKVSVDDIGEKWIKHYCSSHSILLVGEGDFSFGASLAKAFGSAVSMVATSLDSKEVLMQKYSRATTNLNELEGLGCTIIHEVDAHSMSQSPPLKQKLFDRIVFNFPHAGFFMSEHKITQIDLHRHMVKGFFKSARNMLTENGEVHVTHKTTHPFSSWEIEKLAEDAGLCLVKEVPFMIWEYPGYDNKRGDGSRSNKSFPVGECSTFKFAKPSHHVFSLRDHLLRLSIT